MFIELFNYYQYEIKVWTGKTIVLPYTMSEIAVKRKAAAKGTSTIEVRYLFNNTMKTIFRRSSRGDWVNLIEAEATCVACGKAHVESSRATSVFLQTVRGEYVCLMCFEKLGRWIRCEECGVLFELEDFKLNSRDDELEELCPFCSGRIDPYTPHV